MPQVISGAALPMYITNNTDSKVLAGPAQPVYMVNDVIDTGSGGGSSIASTTDLPEGTNLYYTDERAQDAIGTILVDSASIDFTYNDGVPSITATVLAAGVDHNSLANLLVGDAHTQYHTDARALTWLGTRSTTDLPEGTGLYFTDERAQDAVGTILTDSASVDFTYNDGANTITATVIQAGIDHGSIGGLADDDHTQYIIKTPTTDSRNEIQPSAATVKALVLKGAVAQSDNLFETQTSAGTLLSRVEADGKVVVFASGGVVPVPGIPITLAVASPSGSAALAIKQNTARASTPTIIYLQTLDGEIAQFLGVGAGALFMASTGLTLGLASNGKFSAPQITIGTTGTITLASDASTDKVLIVKGKTSQSANLTEWQDVSSNILALVNKDGGLTVNEQGADTDSRIEGDTDVNLFYTDASVDRVGIGTATPGSKLDVAGSLQADSITNDTGLAHGKYTPTLTNVANLTASTAYECQYSRVGNTVTVSGKVDVDPTLTTTSTQLGISLPIASNLGATEDCAGVAFCPTITGLGAAILGDAANNRAQLEFIASDLTNQPMYFMFTYEVI